MNESKTARPAANRLLLFAVMITALGAGLAIGFWIKADRVSLEDIDATIIEPPTGLGDFSLTDHRGSPFTPASLEGKWTFMFFGYTNCPDICPTTLATLTRMDEIIDERGRGDPRQVVFVSVDPERDTVERLSQYVPYFNPSHIGVTGGASDIDRFTSGLGILHVRAGEQGSENYLVNHSTSILLFNPDGALRALFSGLPHDASKLADDFSRIVQLSEHG